MTVPSGTQETYVTIGQLEDISDMIYNIDPTDTPILTAIDRAKATAVLHEWQTDSLATPSDTNFVEEGGDAAIDSATVTVRLSNTCNISDKAISISGTQQAVKLAGRADEMGYQIAKRGKELKRDMEKIILSNNAEVTGSSGTARELGSMLAWIDTNTSAGTGGSDGSLGNTARTDASSGNQRAFTEALYKSVLAAIFDAGGDPTMTYVGSFNKQVMSGFTGNATRMKSAEDKVLTAAIDIYDSDFGELKVMPSRHMRTRDCLILQPDMWAVAYLRPFQVSDLAKTGDTDKKQMLVEYTLDSRNEKASGGVFDLTTS
jgi:hypothetical protein